MNHKQFRLAVLMRVETLIDLSNCSNYQFLGYKHLHQRLILYFDDCKQVYNFDLKGDEIIETSFFTKDFSESEKIQSIGAFYIEITKDIPDTTFITSKLKP